MNLKKLGLVTLATVMLVGCGAKKTNTDAEATASPEATAETETEAAKTGEMDMSEIMAQAGDGTSAKTADLSGYTLVEGESAVQKITLADAIETIVDKKSALIFFGYEGCYWCQRAMPQYNAVAQTAKDGDIPFYYVDMMSQDTTEDQYNALISLLKDVLYKDENGAPALYVPEVLAVHEGTVVDEHLSLIDEYNPDEQEELTAEQKEKMNSIYAYLLDEAKNGASAQTADEHLGASVVTGTTTEDTTEKTTN